MLHVIQGNVIPGNLVAVSTREPSLSSAASGNGSVRAPQPVEFAAGSPGVSQMGFHGTAPILNRVVPSRPLSGQSRPLSGQATPVLSSAPSLAPRVVLPKREVPVSSLNPFPTGLVSPPASSSLLTASNLPRSAGVLTPPVITAPSNITQVGATVAPSIVASEAEIRKLFDTADSNRDGLLEWNSGAVEAFGQAVLRKFGRDLEGSQILLYNTYDDTDRNLDGKMDLNEGVQFARTILERSNPKSQAAVPSSANSLFDTRASANSSAWDTYPNFVQREPYTGRVYEMGSPPASAEQSEQKPDAPGSSVAPRHSEESLEFQRLERENDQLTENNRILSQRLQEMTRAQQSQDLSGALTRAHEENERLENLARELQTRLDASERAQVSSFDPVMNDGKIAALEEQNQILASQIRSFEEQMSHAQHMTNDIARQLEEVQNENAALHENREEMEHQLRLANSHNNSGGFGESYGGASFAGAPGTSMELEALQEREILMSKEIEELLLQNSRDQERIRRLEEALGENLPTDTKKKKFICC